jgi:type IX secretion system PorP/SprF family membrane protein
MVSFFIPILKVFRKTLFLGIFSIVMCNLSGQDVHFTLYNNNPLFLNPANTGNFNGNWRLVANYRNQWGSASNPYKTATLSFDKSFYLRKNKLAAGLFFINDNSGIGGLTFNNLFASLGYEKEIDKNFFNLGLQLGYAFGSVNSWQVWNRNTGEFSLDNGETGMNEKASYFDLNAGLTWKRFIGKYEPEIGFAFSHLNSPKRTFFESSEKEKIRSLFHAKVKIGVTDNLYLAPSLLYMSQENINLTMIGTNIGYTKLGSSRVKQIYTGIYLRNGILSKSDSFSALIGATIGSLDIAFSYDSNISGLSKSAGNMGAYEISLIYRGLSSVINTYSIPCERY